MERLKFSQVTFISEHLILTQKEALKNFQEASFSSILSLASYLCYLNPHAPPPGCPVSEKNLFDTEFPSPQLSYNYYMEPWTDYFVTLCSRSCQKGNIKIENQTMIFVSKVLDEFIEKFMQSEKVQQTFSLKQPSKEELDKTVNGLKRQSKVEKRIGIINFAASQLRNDIYRPKINIQGLMMGIWLKETDEWSVYNILRENYPSEEEILQTDVFIMTGSHYSVNDQIKSVAVWMKLMEEALKMNPKLKVLGLCFGHQSLAKYYGGKVEKLPLYAGLEEVRIHSQVSKDYAFLDESVKKSHSFYISEYHGDYITENPAGFRIVSSSDSCSNEGMISQDGRTLSFQFHAEYSNLYTRSYEMRVKSYFPDDPLKDFAGVARPKFSTQEAKLKVIEDCFRIRNLIRSFFDQ